MPQDSLVWIVLIVAVALVIGLAVWKGRGLRFKRGQEGFSVEVEVEHLPDAPPTGETSSKRGKISVANKARIEETRIGDIAGIKTAGKPQLIGYDIDLAAGTRIKKADVGDIVGLKEFDPKSKDER